jgi:hypothetical protein
VRTSEREREIEREREKLNNIRQRFKGWMSSTKTQHTDESLTTTTTEEKERRW